MRRLAAALLTLAAIAAGVVAMGAAPADTADTYRVDAIFDTAKGVIPGQLVKIAGAPVGTIDDVVLTEDYRARVQMVVEGRFEPFRADARCEIQPEGLISENFVQCDPGRGEPLRPQGEFEPTVPVQSTSAPVSITDLFRIFRAPVRQRFAIISAALGGGVAGRGEDLNEVLRRANPTLAEVRDITSRLAEQRREIGTLVTASDRLIAELADRRDGVTDFVEQAARVTTQTADHSGQLQSAIRNLPPLLDEIDPAVDRVRTLAVDARPVLAQLRASAPDLERLLGDVPAFAAAGRPALKALAGTADTGRAAVKSATPVVDLLRRFAATALPAGQMLDPLFVSLRDNGFSENLLTFVYSVVAATARYDATSHIAPAHLLLSQCSPFAETPVEGCSANYNQTAARDKPPAPARTPRPAKKPELPAVPEVVKPGPPRLEIPGVTDRLPELDLDLAPLPQAVQDAIDGVLGEQGKDLTLDDLASYLLG